MSSDNGTKIGTDNLVGDLRGDVAETREVLGDTAAGLESADVKTHTRDVMRNAAAQTREGSEHAVEQVGGSVRRHPAWWASIGAGVVAAAAAAVGALRWRQARRTPRGRAARAWRGAADRFGR